MDDVIPSPLSVYMIFGLRECVTGKQKKIENRPWPCVH